jgi:hypothetical protein
LRTHVSFAAFVVWSSQGFTTWDKVVIAKPNLTLEQFIAEFKASA